MTILPKGNMAIEDNESKMIQAESKKNAYFFDYTAKTPGQPKVREECIACARQECLLTVDYSRHLLLLQTHFRTIFSLASLPDSAGATLVTITAQAPEDRYKDLKPLFDEIMDSYGKLK